MAGRNRYSRGWWSLIAYALVVTALAAWAAAEHWTDPLDPSHALPDLALGIVALPSMLPLVASGVGAHVGRDAFLALVVLLAWLEGAAVHWGVARSRAGSHRP